MGNSWFRFKKFLIHQDKCAMKVGTDGVLLGALTRLPVSGSPCNQILDIGTGTGLIALMLAQRSESGSTVPFQIDAIEMVREAAHQARENTNQSPWADRIRVVHADFLNFYPDCDTRYDLIVSNPPYFRNSLKSATSAKTVARHGSDGFFRHLLEGSRQLLRPGGCCSFILPEALAPDLERMAGDAGLAVRERVFVRSKPGGKRIRRVLRLARVESVTALDVGERELSIYGLNGDYSEEFAALARPFYLHL